MYVVLSHSCSTSDLSEYDKALNAIFPLQNSNTTLADVLNDDINHCRLLIRQWSLVHYCILWLWLTPCRWPAGAAVSLSEHWSNVFHVRLFTSAVCCFTGFNLFSKTVCLLAMTNSHISGTYSGGEKSFWTPNAFVIYCIKNHSYVSKCNFFLCIHSQNTKQILKT